MVTDADIAFVFLFRPRRVRAAAYCNISSQWEDHGKAKSLPIQDPAGLGGGVCPACPHVCVTIPAADFILKLQLSKLSCHLFLHRRTAGSAFLRALTLLISLHCFVIAPPLDSLSPTAPFIVAPPVLPLLSRHRGLLCHAAVPFLVAPPVLPLSSRRRQFCMCRCATAAFLVAPLLLSSSRCRSLHCRAAALYIYIFFF